MNADGQPFGEALGRAFQAHVVNWRVVTSDGQTIAALSEISRHGGGPVTVSDLAPTEGYMVFLAIDGFDDFDLWENDQRVDVVGLRAGELMLQDWRRALRWRFRSPFSLACLYLSDDVLARGQGEGTAGRLKQTPGKPLYEPTIGCLIELALGGVRDRSAMTDLFFDHLITALAAQIGHQFRQWRSADGATGGLAPRDLAIVCDRLSASLDRNVALAELAALCGLSPGYLSRAFKQSTGMAPHQWVLNRRVETAKTMLRSTDAPLAQIAVDCGFADQSHLTRMFKRHVSLSPHAWRRSID